MKMMSSTSMMSTSGVTLMFVISWSSPPALDAMILLPDERLEVAAQGVPEALAVSHDGLEPAAEQVVDRDRRQRDQQADGRLHQRLGDAGHDAGRADAHRALLGI